MDETTKRIDELIAKLKEIDSDLSNVIVLGCDVKQLDSSLRKLSKIN